MNNTTDEKCTELEISFGFRQNKTPPISKLADTNSKPKPIGP